MKRFTIALLALATTTSLAFAEPEGSQGPIELVGQTFHVYNSDVAKLKVVILEKQSWAIEGYEGFSVFAEFTTYDLRTQGAIEGPATDIFEVACSAPYEVEWPSRELRLDVKLDTAPGPKMDPFAFDATFAGDLWWAACHENYMYHTEVWSNVW